MTAAPYPFPGPRAHPSAGPALATGVVAATGVLLVVPLCLGPLAWFLGARAGRLIERDPQRWTGRGTARAATVLGVVATALLALVLAFLALAVTGTLVVRGHETGYPA